MHAKPTLTANEAQRSGCANDRIEDTDVNAKLMLSTERDDGREEGLFNAEMWAEAFLGRAG